MTNNSPNYHNYIYSAIVVFGILICITAIYISTSKTSYFEHNTNRVHRLITASEIELATLEREITDIESTINSLKSELDGKPDKNKKLAQQFFTLKRNIVDLRNDIAEKQKLLITLNLLKTSTLSQIKTLFWINSALLVIGSLLFIIGTAALAFKLEVFQDRRQKNRPDQEDS